jgi:hypothetical protein
MLEGLQHGTQQMYPGVTAGYPPQVGPQTGIGGPFAGVLSSGVQGLLGNIVGRQIDPVTQAYLQQAQLQQLQQAQLGPQVGIPGLLGNPLATLGTPFGVQQPWGSPMGIGQIGGLARLDPITAAYIQQAQIAQQLVPQSLFGNPLAALIGNPLQNIGPFGGQIGRPLPIGLDPVTAACLQQAQFAHALNQSYGSPFGVPQFGPPIGRLPFQMGGFPTAGYGQWY